MSVDGLIEMPSFRPDGRLERLNHGGGSKLPKTIPGEPKRFQNQPDLLRIAALAIHQKNHGNKSKELDFEVGYQGGPYGVKAQAAAGQKTSSGTGKPMVAKGAGLTSGTGGSEAGAVYSERPPEAASAVAAPKKRRTLLSGGGRSFNQPYGYDTVLGA